MKDLYVDPNIVFSECNLTELEKLVIKLLNI